MTVDELILELQKIPQESRGKQVRLRTDNNTILHSIAAVRPSRKTYYFIVDKEKKKGNNWPKEDLYIERSLDKRGMYHKLLPEYLEHTTEEGEFIVLTPEK